MLSENVAWTGVLGPSGAPIATREIARHRIDATGRHIVRGLHYFEFGRPVDPDAAVLLGFLSANWTPSHPMILEFAKMYFHSEQRQKDVGKALSYAVGRWEDKSCWMLLLYGTFMWLGTIGPPPNDDVIISDPARIPDPI
ncbi:MAG: hypothetical protein ABI824_17075 [Acidobacteriota bacterium]